MVFRQGSGYSVNQLKQIISRIFIGVAMAGFLLPAAEAFSVSGQIQIISPPSSVLANVLESDNHAFVFRERQNVTLGSDLPVDQLISSGSAGSISAGTVINSTFFHFDPVGIAVHSSDLVTVLGSITFDRPILGFIWTGVACPEPCPFSPEYLDASDFLGAAGTQYPTNGLGRGLEADAFYDHNGSRDLIVNIDATSIGISATAFPDRSDQLRVITAGLPEPGTFWLFAFGMAGIMLFVRKRFPAALSVYVAR